MMKSFIFQEIGYYIDVREIVAIGATFRNSIQSIKYQSYFDVHLKNSGIITIKGDWCEDYIDDDLVNAKQDLVRIWKNNK